MLKQDQPELYHFKYVMHCTNQPNLNMLSRFQAEKETSIKERGAG